MVHVMSMDRMIPYLVFDRYIGKWTESDIDVGIPLRRFLVRHVIVVLG